MSVDLTARQGQCVASGLSDRVFVLSLVTISFVSDITLAVGSPCSASKAPPGPVAMEGVLTAALINQGHIQYI